MQEGGAEEFFKEAHVLIWMIVVALVMFIAILFYASNVENQRYDSVTKAHAEAGKKIEIMMKSLEKYERSLAACDSAWKTSLGEKYKEQHVFNANLAREVDRITKEFSVLEVRQRTLEKSIIRNERTVNLVFNKPIPVEHVPHIVNKEKKVGRGKSALLDPKGRA